jgi:lysozyme
VNPSGACLYLIRSSEGCRLTAYKDSAGVWTVGYGSTGHDVKPGLKITMKRAEELLASDVAEAADAVNKYALPCTQGQFDALTDFVFNLGEGAFARSTLLRKHQAGNYTGAAQEFARWIYAGGKPLPGLIKRRAAEAHLYLSDKLPHSEDEE